MMDDENRRRICLDCSKMMHDPCDYAVGRCAEDGHKIDNINNHSWCKHYSAPYWWKPYIYEDDEDPCDMNVEDLRVVRIF